MNFDLRLPLGILFSLFGIILVIYGKISGPEIYAKHSLGINVNFGWGIVLLIFGLFMLFLAIRSKNRPR